MKLIWNGHSCFSVQAEGKTIVFDPYADDCVPGLAPLRLTADKVYCSHGHRDHNAADLVTLTGADCGLSVQAIPVFHDKVLGLRRGRNTIHILSAEGLRVAHLGDLGHIPGKAVLAQLQGVDALLIPVGGHFTIDAAAAYKLVQRLSPRVVIPMHYRLGGMGYPVIQELHQFTDLCSNVVYYDTNTLELTGDTQPQTAVLSYYHG
jgi:L-ascorbate metabolism protein UlaG (beta-lactamase superfamily)